MAVATTATLGTSSLNPVVFQLHRFAAEQPIGLVAPTPPTSAAHQRAESAGNSIGRTAALDHRYGGLGTAGRTRCRALLIHHSAPELCREGQFAAPPVAAPMWGSLAPGEALRRVAP